MTFSIEQILAAIGIFMFIILFVKESNIFKCNHPFDRLQILKDATQEPDKKYSEDFDIVTYHFQCSKCNKELDKTYAKMIGGIDEFLARGENKT